MDERRAFDAETRTFDRVLARRLVQESQLLIQTSKYICEEARQAVTRARSLAKGGIIRGGSAGYFLASFLIFSSITPSS